MEKSGELKARSFRMELIPATEEPSEEMYSLYKEFQRDEFNESDDEMSYEGFAQFLGESSMEQNNEEKLGTFWWNWYVDNELIACSILDILPTTIVSLCCMGLILVVCLFSLQDFFQSTVDWYSWCLKRD